MEYATHYDSPLGDILLLADGKGLTGLWFDGEKYQENHPAADNGERSLPVFEETKRWLDIYFTGREPDFMPSLHVTGSDFQIMVWNILRKIPYGEITTYGAIAKKIAVQRGLPRMSAQAVGGAVGRNEIAILIPCHRVMGSDGSLTGYGGGLEKKSALLQLEGIMSTNC